MGATSLTRGRLFAVVGLAAALAAVVADAHASWAAARQDWPPFVLVIGLLLIGLVADHDGLFRSTGDVLGGLARHPLLLYAGAVVAVSTVTATLNLDTSVAFLTPVLIYTARRLGGGEAPMLYGCVLLSNAASLLLPGSNLTNLIILGHLHLSGHSFFVRMLPAWAVAVVITAVGVGVFEQRDLRDAASPQAATRTHPRLLVALPAVAAATVLVLVLHNPALPVAAVALVAVGLRGLQLSRRRILETVGLPTLLGLFGVAIALGTLGRDWSAPTMLLGHLDRWGTAWLAAALSVLVNNLPAASLLAARTPQHPFALLVGLNVGPNFFVTGSLAWLLWWRAAQTAGVRPSLAHAARLGIVLTPLALTAAVGALSLTGTH